MPRGSNTTEPEDMGRSEPKRDRYLQVPAADVPAPTGSGMGCIGKGVRDGMDWHICAVPCVVEHFRSSRIVFWGQGLGCMCVQQYDQNKFGVLFV